MRRSIGPAAHDMRILGYLAIVPGLIAGVIALLMLFFSLLSITDTRPLVPWFGTAMCTGTVAAVALGWLVTGMRKNSTLIVGFGAMMFWFGVVLLMWWGRDDDPPGVVVLTALVPILTASNGWALHIARRLHSRIPDGLSRPHATRRLTLPRDARMLRALSPALIGSLQVLLALLGVVALAPLLRQGAISVSFNYFMPIAFRYFRHVRAVLALRAQEVRLKDRRPPVLLLRSFADDELVMQRTKAFLVNVTSTMLSLEEQIVAQLWEVGPVVAIGQPGLDTDPIGAAREHIVGPLWQSRVQVLIEESVLVVVVLGQTEGLFWEYEQLSRHRVSLLVIWPPSAPDVLTNRWQRFTTAYPPARSIVLEVETDLPLLVWFRTDNEPLIVSGHSRDERSYELAFALWHQNRA